MRDIDVVPNVNVAQRYPTLSPKSDVRADSYRMLTIMDGPGVTGLERYWLGYFREDLHDDDGSFLARPVGHQELPHPMTRPEIEDWALDRLSIPDDAF